jgi:long-chain fatty acid transport protein
MRKNFLAALLFAALLFAPLLASASAFEVINVNPRDLGMSHSLVASQQDAAASYMNPAALSKLDGLNLSLAGSVLDIRTKWTAPSGNPALTGTSKSNFAPTTPVALFVAYGTRVADRGLGVGFGMGTPGGGQVEWDDDWQGRGRIITVQRRMLGFYLNGGYEVLPFLRLGGGAIYYYGLQYLKQGVQPFNDAFAELNTKGGGLAYQLSAEVKALENLTFGIDYKHKAVMSMDGDAHFQVPPALQGPTTQDQGVKQDLPFPNLLAVGAAYRIAKPWLVTLQYNYARFRVYDEDLFIGDTGFTVRVPRDYRDGHVIRGGVEWNTTERLILRAGLMRDFSGLRKNTLSPTLPDSHTTGAAVGAGYTFRPGLAVNGAFFYGDRDKQTAEGPIAFPGSYKTNVWIASLGVVWATGVGARAP